ncbi:nitrilase-related carbon-nitrogen hydrolase [Salinibacterium sp. PAMC 21357]|uniref:nitrilase-related carbon-nitrogen hydrolase n=1 Tax=Salinibacterium sp. PAMC 21357 TaxID=1112215 RepID=UPI00047531A2|nr:nitrilase-related carbon-nitrogen hydrolase [Salinibacterium sp. PAMC 21357]
MRIALLQSVSSALNPDTNFDALMVAAERAAAAGAQVLITPELFATGYVPEQLGAWLAREKIAGFAERFAAIARASGIAIVGSYPAARAVTRSTTSAAGDDSETDYEIRAGLWDDAGKKLVEYAKVHLWSASEHAVFQPANALSEIVVLHGRRVALQICYDIEFAEPARALASRGAEILFVPTAIDAGGRYVAETIVPARAAENGIYVAYVNHASLTGDVSDFLGGSVAVGPEGVRLAQAAAAPEMLIVDVPESGRVADSADYLGDRRPEVYAAWEADSRAAQEGR